MKRTTDIRDFDGVVISVIAKLLETRLGARVSFISGRIRVVKATKEKRITCDDLIFALYAPPYDRFRVYSSLELTLDGGIWFPTKDTAFEIFINGEKDLVCFRDPLPQPRQVVGGSLAYQ